MCDSYGRFNSKDCPELKKKTEEATGMCAGMVECWEVDGKEEKKNLFDDADECFASMFDCSTFLEGTEGQAEFCQGGIGWHWFEPSISEDDVETVPELWDGKEDNSGSEGESILCRRPKRQSGDTISEGTSSEDEDEEAYTTEEVGRYEFDLWDVNANIIKVILPL